MKALTICQPYAHLIAIGEKPIENRTWSTAYRGPLLIHAGKSHEWLGPSDIAEHPLMVFGAVVALARLVGCVLKGERDWPARFVALQHHPHANGPWCWILEDVRRLKVPVRAQGSQGLWMPDTALIQACERQVAA